MSQTSEILKQLQEKGTITSMEAFKKYGATRLSSIIFELRKKYDIQTIMSETTNRYGEYTRYGIYQYIGEKADE